MGATVVYILDVDLSSNFGSNLSGSRDVMIHVTIRIPMGHFVLVVHWTQVSISIRFKDVFEIFGVKHIGVRTLIFLGHVTSSVT